MKNMSEKKRSKVTIIAYLCITALLVFSIVSATTVAFAAEVGEVGDPIATTAPATTFPYEVELEIYNTKIVSSVGGSVEKDILSQVNDDDTIIELVRFTAIPNAGYKFDHWDIDGSYSIVSGSLTDVTITINRTSDTILTPYFVEGEPLNPTDPVEPEPIEPVDPTVPSSDNDTANVKYSVEPTYMVNIPATVTLGSTSTISSEDVVVEKGKQVEVTLTGTSEDDNSFKLKSAEGAEIEYTIKNNDSAVSLNDKVLIVNPDTSSTGNSTLSFVAPSDVTYSGSYTGTITFNVAVANA